MTTFINFCISHRFLVIFGVLMLGALGVRAVGDLPIDAVPDVTNVQVQMATEVVTDMGTTKNALQRSRYRLKRSSVVGFESTPRPEARS